MSILQSVITMTVFLPIVFCVCGVQREMNTVELNASNDIVNANHIIQRINGVWRAMGTGVNGGVYDIIASRTGEVYATGTFTEAGGVAANRIAKYDPTTDTWSALGNGLDGLSGQEMAFDAAGNLYVVGNFTSVDGGLANTRGIAMWDGSAWHAVGTGFNNIGLGVCWNKGILYATGGFTTAGGNAAQYIAKWDSSAWSALGSGLDSWGYSVAVDPLGRLFAIGSFENAGGVPAQGIAMWDGSAWRALGAGVGTPAEDFHKVLVTPEGIVWAFGSFITPGRSVAYWNGNEWFAAGVGISGGIGAVSATRLSSGELIVGGAFNTAGGLDINDHVASWNRSTWSPLDVDLPGLAIVFAVASDANDNLWLGFTTAGTATSSGVPVTTIDNTGTVSARPRIVIKRSGGTSATLEMIQNITTNDVLLFNWALMDGEEIVIDLAAHTITSSITGNQLSKVLQNSNFSTFRLAPGINEVAVYISSVGSPTITAYIQWETQYLSIDGVAQ